MPYRAKEDGVEGPELLESVLRHHAAGFQVALAAPVEFLPGERKTKAPRGGLGNANSLGDDFPANAIAGNGGDFVSFGGGGHVDKADSSVFVMRQKRRDSHALLALDDRISPRRPRNDTGRIVRILTR